MQLVTQREKNGHHHRPDQPTTTPRQIDVTLPGIVSNTRPAQRHPQIHAATYTQQHHGLHKTLDLHHPPLSPSV